MEQRFSLISPLPASKSTLPHSTLPEVLPQKRAVSQIYTSKQASPPQSSYKRTIKSEMSKLKLSVTAGQTLDTYLSMDEEHLELEDSQRHSQPEDPYQQANSEYLLTRKRAIPRLIVERYRACSKEGFLSGILPEIHRVWFSMDNVLMLWDYETNDNIIEYPHIEDIITGVALVDKNSDIFTSKVAYMLVVATRIQVTLLGVSLEPEFRLIPADIQISTDEVAMEVFGSMSNGRILMGGNDGHINELKYTSTSWFSSTKRYKKSDLSALPLSSLLPKFIKNINPSRVIQISLDRSRNLLYSLVETDSRSGRYKIELYDMGVEGKSFKRVVTITSAVLLQRLREHNQRLVTLSPVRLEVVHISSLSRTLSNEYQLMALTRNGLRVYFNFRLEPVQQSHWDEGMLFRPSPEFSIYVKFPPAAVKSVQSQALRPTTLGITSDRPSNYEKALFTEKGSLFIVDSHVSACRLVSISRSLSKLALLQGERGKVVLEPDETVSCIDEFRDVEIQAICEVPSYVRMGKHCAELCGYLHRSEYLKNPSLNYLGSRSTTLSIQCLTTLANINYVPPSRIMLLTSSELIEYTEVRPIDLVFQALELDPPSDITQIRDLSMKYSLVHVCAMILAILTTPMLLVSCTGQLNEKLDSKFKEKAWSIFRQMGNAKTWDSMVHSFRPEDPLMSLGEYKALYLHIGRILRPVWQEPVTYTESDIKNQIEQFHPNQIRELKLRLELLHAFLKENYEKLIDESLLEKASKINDPLMQLYILIRRSIEVTELLILFSEDYSFRRIVNELIPDEQKFLMSITFRELVCSSQGHSLTKALIDGYITQLRNPRINRGRRVRLEDCLKMLHSKCPSYFTEADSEIFVAEECLKKAREENDMQIKEDYINEGVKRMLRNAASLGLPRVVAQLRDLHSYMNIVFLCLQKAKDLKEVKELDDTKEIDECYEQVFQLLGEVQEAISAGSAMPLFALVPRDKLLNLKKDILYECCKQADKRLHWAIFTWLVQLGNIQEILDLESPFLKEFLSQKFDIQHPLGSLLLAKYCMKVGDYSTAFEEFGQYAAQTQENLPIEKVTTIGQRLDYLDLCHYCLEKHIDTSKGTQKEMIKLKEEKNNLELRHQLAKIQAVVKQELLASIETSTDETERLNRRTAALKLDRSLLTFPELYNDFSRAFSLWDSQMQLLDYVKTNSITEPPDLLETMRSVYIPLIKSMETQPWPQRIKEKIELYGRNYPYAFPYKHIISKCEAINVSKNIRSSWLISLLVSLPIPYTLGDFFDAYLQVWQSYRGDLESCWYLLLRFEVLLKYWCEEIDKRITGSDMWSTRVADDKISTTEFQIKAPMLIDFVKSALETIEQLPTDKKYPLQSSFLSIDEKLENLRSTQVRIQPFSGEASFTEPNPAKRLLFSEVSITPADARADYDMIERVLGQTPAERRSGSRPSSLF
jgi:hypothetical protein